MHQLFSSLAVLACPVGMGVMMWMMMRGQGHGGATSAPAPDDSQRQVAQLRAEIDELKAERARAARG